jgi:hypothetical protein
VLTITNVVPESDTVQKQLLFLPGLVTAGIEPSDDQLITTRDAAYPISFLSAISSRICWRDRLQLRLTRLCAPA